MYDLMKSMVCTSRKCPFVRGRPSLLEMNKDLYAVVGCLFCLMHRIQATLHHDPGSNTCSADSWHKAIRWMTIFHFGSWLVFGVRIWMQLSWGNRHSSVLSIEVERWNVETSTWRGNDKKSIFANVSTTFIPYGTTSRIKKKCSCPTQLSRTST